MAGKKGGSFQRKAAAAMRSYMVKGMSAGEARKRAFGGMANAARGASPAAKRRNPNLKRVRGA